MPRQYLEHKHGASRWRACKLRADDWPLFVALLPAVLTSAAITITITVAMAFCSTSSWPDWMPSHVAEKPTSEIEDDYVEGLVRRGLAASPFLRDFHASNGDCGLTQVR